MKTAAETTDTAPNPVASSRAMKRGGAAEDCGADGDEAAGREAGVVMAQWRSEPSARAPGPSRAGLVPAPREHASP